MKQRISGKKIYAIRYAISMIFMAIVCLAVGFGLVGCGPTETDPVPKLLEGDSVTIEEKWDSRLISETAADTFWIKTNVRSDTAGAADKAGAIFIDYGSTAVYLTVAGGDDASDARVFFMARQDGEIISMRAYDTAATGFEGVNHKIDLETIWTGSAFYVGVNDVWTKIDAHTSAAVSEGTFDFFATGAHRFGVASTKATAYHETIASSTDIATRLGEIEFSLELDVQDGGVAQLSATTVLLGNSVCLTVTTDTENVVRNTPVVVFNEATLNGVENGGIFTYEFMPKASGTISVQFQKAYKVTGTFGYAEGLYAEGDEVTLSGVAGAITGNSYEVWLPEGEQTITLVSDRFADVTATVTVSAEGENTAEKVTFTELKFADGTVTSNGKVTETTRSFHPFAGVSAKDFQISVTVADGKNRGIVIKDASDAEPLYVYVKNSEGKARLGFAVNRDPWEIAYTLGVNYQDENTVTMIRKEGVYYVSVNNSSWLKITADTAVAEGDKGRFFDATGWIFSDTEKTFGVGCWNESHAGDIKNISYSLNPTIPTENIITAAFSDGSFVVDGNYNLNSYKQFAGVNATQFVVSVTSKSYTQDNFGTLSAGIGIQKSGTWDTVQIVLQKNDNGKVNVVMYDCGSRSTYTFITDADWKEDEEGGNRITLIQKGGTLYIRANEGSYFKITEFADDCSKLRWILSLGTDCGFGIVPLDGAQFGEAGSVAVSGIEYSVDADTVTKAVTDAEGNLYLGA